MQYLTIFVQNQLWFPSKNEKNFNFCGFHGNQILPKLNVYGQNLYCVAILLEQFISYLGHSDTKYTHFFNFCIILDLLPWQQKL